MDRVKRDKDGRLLPGGAVINPQGHNGHNEGWQPYGQRLQKWLKKSGEELEEYFADSGAKLKKLSTIDINCVQVARGMVTGDKILQYTKEAVDRIEGTPKQTVEHTGDKDNPVVIDFMLNFHSPDQETPAPDANRPALPPPDPLPEAT